MKKYVLTDCFDTIITRDCLPEEIKKIWSQKASELFKYKVNSEDLYCIRKSVEIELFAQKYSQGCFGEFNIEEVYSLILDRLVVSGKVQEKTDNIIKELLNLELEIEKKHQKVKLSTINKLQKHKNEGADLYVVSDFYMGSEYLWEMLKNLKIEHLFSGVYVSCDYGLNKSSGTLYDYVINDLDADPFHCIMLGDNKVSDIKVAKRKGLKTKLIKKDNNKALLLSSKQTYKTHFKELFLKTFKYYYSNYAFMFYVFVDNLVKQCKLNNINKLYFLSREGQFLKKLFDEYVRYNNIDISTHYLQVSRNSTFIASLRDIQAEEFNVLFRQYKNISVNDFLKSLTFTSEEISLFNNVDHLIDVDIDTEVPNFKESLVFKKLKSNTKFIELYNKKRQEQKCLFKQYMNELSFDEKNEILNIVDVGWKGSMQDNIFNIYEGRVKINGLYLGLYETGSVSLKSTKKGLLFDFVSDGVSERNNILSYRHHYYESLLRANHSRVENYKMVNSKIHIIYEETPDEEFYLNYLENYHKEVYSKFTALLDICSKNEISNLLLNRIVPYIHLKMMFKTNKNDFALINASMSSFREGFGKVGNVGINYKYKDYYLDKLRALKRLIKYRKLMW